MNWFYYVCDFIFNFVEFRMIFWMIGEGLESRWNKKTSVMIQYAFCGILAALYTSNIITTKALFSNINLMIIIFLITIIGNLIYRGKRKKIFIIVILAMLGVVLWDFGMQAFLLTVLEKNGKNKTQFLMIGSARGLYLLLFSAGICMIQIYWKQDVLNIVMLFRTHSRKILLIIPILCLIVIYYQRIYSHITETEIGNWMILVVFLYSMLLVLVVNSIRMKSQEEKKLLKLKNEMINRDYERTLQLYQQKSELIHDEKNHLLLIGELARQEKLKEIISYVEQFTKVLSKSGRRVETGNSFLNILFNIKLQDAENIGIQVEYNFDDMSDLIIEEIDLCVLFCNAIDNAIEANEKIPVAERKLFIKGQRQGHFCIINISNPITEPLIKKNGRLVTSKENKKMHGFGMDSMKRIADKYNGYLNYYTEEKTFILTIYLMGFTMKL